MTAEPRPDAPPATGHPVVDAALADCAAAPDADPATQLETLTRAHDALQRALVLDDPA